VRHQPETNGVAERFFRTLKEQVIWGRIFHDAAELTATVAVSSRPRRYRFTTSASASAAVVGKVPAHMAPLVAMPSHAVQRRASKIRKPR
jgi:hypothetical protein